MLKKMILIRIVSKKISEFYHEEEMRCPIHLSIGQEASAVGICSALRRRDRIFSFHRCHAHYLSAGGGLKKMIAELYGKKTGCTGGIGGSMHLADHGVNFMGASSIVGGAIPIAAGSALAAKLKKEERVFVVFFGDGATEQGVFYETLSFSALKKLPVIFVCENNMLAVKTPLLKRQPQDNIFMRGKSFGIGGFRVNGQDVLEVYFFAKEALGRCASGKGPVLIECRVERWGEHVEPRNYRENIINCPIEKLKKFLLEKKDISHPEIESIYQKTEETVLNAFDFAKKSPFPRQEEVCL